MTLTFFGGARLVRAHLNSQESNTLIFFLEYDGIINYFSGNFNKFNDIAKILPNTLSVDNILRYAEFYLTIFQGKKLFIISSIDDLYDFILTHHPTRELNFERVLATFEPAFLSLDSHIMNSTVFFYYVEGKSYYRCSFGINGNFSTPKIDVTVIFEDIFSKIHSRPTQYRHTSEAIDFAPFKLEEVFDVMSRTPIGGVLATVAQHHNIQFTHIESPNNSYLFNPKLKIILHAFNPSHMRSTEEEAIDLVYVLRWADLELAGYTPPDPLTDVIKYAAFMHARNLELIICVCDYVEQSLRETNKPHYYSQFLDHKNLNEFYRLKIKGSSKKTLYEEYSRIYNIQD